MNIFIHVLASKLVLFLYKDMEWDFPSYPRKQPGLNTKTEEAWSATLRQAATLCLAPRDRCLLVLTPVSEVQYIINNHSVSLSRDFLI